MSKTVGVYPPVVVNLEQVREPGVKVPFQQICNVIQALRDHFREVINFNRVGYVSQAAQPTPIDGAFTVWKDSDATTGNSTHFLVYNDAGTVITFASEETVP